MIRGFLGLIEGVVTAFYAWTQDVPIDAAAYRDIAARMGTTPMPGLVVHVALERDDGSVHYLDVWESPAGEPPRTPVDVLEVRFTDGTSRP